MVKRQLLETTTLTDRYGASQLAMRLVGQDPRVHVDGHALQRVMLARPPVRATAEDEENGTGSAAMLPVSFIIIFSFDNVAEYFSYLMSLLNDYYFQPIPGAKKKKKHQQAQVQVQQQGAEEEDGLRPGSQRRPRGGGVRRGGGGAQKQNEAVTKAQKHMAAERAEKARLRRLDEAWRSELAQAQATIFRETDGNGAQTPDEAYVKESKQASRRFEKREHRYVSFIYFIRMLQLNTSLLYS